MKGLYSSPLRVYLALAALALAGVIAGTRLPVSLFPSASKPSIGVVIPYGPMTAPEFIQVYGNDLEGRFRAVQAEDVHVTKVTANYGEHSSRYNVEFSWGDTPVRAEREINNVVNSFSSRFSLEVRDGISTWTNGENSGFLAISFASPKRDVGEVFKLIDPVLSGPANKVPDVQGAGIWNPASVEVAVELDPVKMAALKLLPRDVDQAISSALEGYSGGSILIDQSQLSVQMPRRAMSPEELGHLRVGNVHLSDIARIDLGPKTADARIMKTSGSPSVIFFADPKPGGNVKRMSEDLIDLVKSSLKNLPADIESRNIVDPSEFIRSAVNNVFREVLMGALLAVAILYLFIGSLRNTITAAIEIPLSMVLAFILMRMSGMNLNLISLGGLALSAGMNVDASVVVMENIFRHFEEIPAEARAKLDFRGRLDLVVLAVKEVRLPVIASTIASLVVFLPLAFTSDLTNGILGDLAKTVVFSHGFSMFVALILVPTVRLHLMARGTEKPHKPPIEGLIKRIEDGYAASLGYFLARPKLQKTSYLGLAALLAVLLGFVLPSLPREVVGKPDTDWIYMGINTSGNRSLRQMDSQVEEIEARLMEKMGSHSQYTFTQVRSFNSASIMARLADKTEMRAMRKLLEDTFPNTATTQFSVDSWNPAELPIPNPPQMKLVLYGGEPPVRSRAARDLQRLLSEGDVFPRVWSDPDSSERDQIVLRPNTDFLADQAGTKSLTSADLADLVRVATNGRKVAKMSIDGTDIDVMIRYPENRVRATEDLEGLPVGVGSKIIPLKALTRISREESEPDVVREDGRQRVVIWGKEDSDKESFAARDLEQASVVLEGWKKSPAAAEALKSGVTVAFEDSQFELTGALRQLEIAVGLSIVLIFLTLVFQFGDAVNALLVLVAVPLGLIGVLTSLFVFRSTLSLNSVLGVILLNGIAVANSIILVDFLKKRVDDGLSPRDAAVDAGRKRLRPILITSLTTILGMMPIALGLGEGGRILQPLGIAVSGGLWVSMALTLFVAPALQVSYLDWRRSRAAVAGPRIGETLAETPFPARKPMSFGYRANRRGPRPPEPPTLLN